jgi:plasmid rolling circle replication initiator protein Rep
MPYEEIVFLEGISACRRSLVRAFEKEQYHRRVAKEKPLLTEKHKKNRLTWAKEYEDWTEEDWLS